MVLLGQLGVVLLVEASVASAAALHPRGGWNPWNTEAEDATTTEYHAPEATSTHTYEVPAAETTSVYTYTHTYEVETTSSMSSNTVAPISASPSTTSSSSMSTSSMSSNTLAADTTSPVTSSMSTMTTSSSSMSSNTLAPISASPTTTSSSSTSTDSTSSSSDTLAPVTTSSSTSSMSTMTTSTISLSSAIGMGSTTIPVPSTTTSTTSTSSTSAAATPVDYKTVVDKWRALEGLNPLARSAQLEANALKTVTDSQGQLIHELNPGSYAQVLAPGNAGNFENVYVGGWLCEIPTLPGLNGICDTAGVGWDHQGQTGHADILSSTQYTQIGCALNFGVWACDLAF